MKSPPSDADRPLGADPARGRTATLFGALFAVWLAFLIVLALLNGRR